MFKTRQSRQGAMGPFTAIMLIPMLAMVAFAVDLGYIWRTDAELQNAADSAALAGAAQLGNAFYMGGMTGMTKLTDSQKLVLLQNASTQAKLWAKSFGDMHLAGFESCVVVVDDIHVYYTADPDDPDGQLETPSVAKMPNAVQVTVRRDSEHEENSNPLGLIFARVIGWQQIDRAMTATAAVKPLSIVGFSGNNPGILPIVMHEDIFKWLSQKGGKRPSNVRNNDGDLWKVEGNPGGSYDVTPGTDGSPEGTVYGYKQSGNKNSDDPALADDPNYASGNWGIVDLEYGTSGVPGNNKVANWITNGVQNGEFDNWPNGFVATPANPLSVNVQPGYHSSLQSDLESIIGQPRIMPVYKGLTSGSGGGATSSYQVIGFAGVTIVDVKLSGNTSRSYLRVQLTSLELSENVVIASGNQSGLTSASYQVVLCR